MSSPLTRHKFLPEATNNGHYFSECSCTWSGGVYTSRASAMAAYRAHVDGRDIPPPVGTVFLFGGPTTGQAVSS